MSNRPVYVVGGGVSLRGFSFHRLKDLDTIAINEAVRDVPHPTYSITADSGTMRKCQDGYFNGIETTWVWVTNPDHCSMKWNNGRFKHVKSGYIYNLFTPNMLIRNNGVDGIGKTFSDFKTGYNSGFCGFQLAYLLGYGPIYLLGFDLRGEGGQTHYHDRYQEKRINQDRLDLYFNNFMKALRVIEKETDVQVISCSESSRLNEIISFMTFDDTLLTEQTYNCVEIEVVPQSGSDPVFSILICSLERRKTSLETLLSILRPQQVQGVEILTDIDRGQVSIGAKRNRLLRRAKGEYIAFIDDDDTVSPDYVCKVLNALRSKPDCCSLIGEVNFRNKRITRPFKHSIEYKDWFQANKVYYRCPNHLNPVKRELAMKVMFPEINEGEDRQYSFALLPLLKTEAKIEGTIYFYQIGC